LKTWKEVVERGTLTFLMSALPIVVASGANWVDVAVWKTAGLAGGASLFSFALNSARKMYTEQVAKQALAIAAELANQPAQTPTA
jgi:hypothetical protein